MAVVTVHASQPYEVSIDEAPIESAASQAANMGADAVFLVSDDNVAPLYAPRILDACARVGLPCASFVFPAGESSKTFATYAACLDAMARAHATRSTIVVALGGGVVGDLAGFAAATYMRGCRFIQIPTSLLACVDSSVGGKTGIDLDAGKNLVGAFHQPSSVLIDTSLLETLPDRFFIDGTAEVLKYGIIADPALFAELETRLMPNDARIPSIVCRCIEIKRDVVQADEYERGVRRILNFGHTVGHAIERLSSYSVTHGFAVATGMALIARASACAGFCSESDARRVEKVVERYGFKMRPRFSASALAEAAASDKKRSGASIDTVCLRAVGAVEIVPMTLDRFARFIEAACADGAGPCRI